MPRHIIKKTIKLKGLDYRSTDLDRAENSCTDCLNVMPLSSGHLSKRPGFQIKAASGGGFGLAIYEKRTIADTDTEGWGEFAWGDDPWGSPYYIATGAIDREILSLRDTPKRWIPETVTVTNSSGSAATVIIRVVSGKYRFVLLSGSSTLLNYDCGTGEEGSPVTVATLVTAISAVSGFSAVASGNSSAIAASLDIGESSLASGDSLDVSYGIWENIYVPTASSWGQVESKLGTSSYSNPSTVTINSVLYAANGFDALHKYDGQSFYRAGMPNGQAPVAAASASAGVLNGSYYYRMAYKQVDSKGNIVEGQISDSSSLVSPASKKVDLTLSTISSNSGFNTGCALANGTQTSTTVSSGVERLVVDNGSGGSHTLRVGDMAYFYNTTTSSYEQYEVYAVTSSTLDILNASHVSVTDNSVISANLRIVIYRTVASGTSLFYVVAEVPNNSFVSTDSYSDNTADADLGAEYIEPIKELGLPPIVKYLQIWNGQLIAAGNPDNPNLLYYSAFGDIISPELFPPDNYVDCRRTNGGVIKGLFQLDRNLIIGTENSILLAEGNLAADLIKIDPITQYDGLASNETFAAVGESVMWLGNKGVWRLSPRYGNVGSAGGLQLVSSPLDPFFNSEMESLTAFAFSRASASLLGDSDSYVLFIPSETVVGGIPYANSESKVFVFDSASSSWYRWSALNMAGGCITLRNESTRSSELWFTGRESGNVYRLYKMLGFNSKYCFTDHLTPISCSFSTQWHDGGYPGIDKQYVNFNTYYFSEGSRLPFQPQGTWTVDVDKNYNPGNSESTLSVSVNATNPYVTKSFRGTKKRSIRFIYSNAEENQGAIITGIEYSFYPYGIQLKR